MTHSLISGFVIFHQFLAILMIFRSGVRDIEKALFVLTQLHFKKIPEIRLAG